MTVDEFERAYAERSGLTVEDLHEFGLHGRPCRCEEDGCHGWQMLSDEAWSDPLTRFLAGVITAEQMRAEVPS